MQRRRSVRLRFRNEVAAQAPSSTTHNSIVVTCSSYSPYTEATVNARTGGRIR